MEPNPQEHPLRKRSWLHGRLVSVYNDLFYSNAEPSSSGTSDRAAARIFPRLTLRTMFASVWVIAALAATWRFDLSAILLVGIPVGLLGYNFVAYGKCHPGFFVVFLLWGAIGFYYCYLFPYTKTRIKNFPPSATKLYAEGDWFCERVRFSASVNDCRVAADRLVVEDRRYFSDGQPNPRPINKKQGQFPTLRKRTNYEQRPWWFDPQNIELGWQYEFTFTQIWIDSERGLFYYEFLD